MWPVTNYVSPVRMHGPALPEQVVVLQFRRREKEVRHSVLIPRRISGREGIGKLFEYRVEAVRSAANPDYFGHDDTQIDLKAIKGTAITLTFSEVYRKQRDWVSARDCTGDREISGMVESAEILGTEGNTVVYEFVMRPWWWRATLCKNSRIFVGAEAEILEVLQTVLKPYSNDIEFRVGHSAAHRRDFIRQTWETDWDFCMRLCEEFGYLIWFEHHDGRHVLVIADSIRACQEHSPPYETLPYRPDGGHLDRGHVTHLSWRTSVAIGTVTVHDHSYVSPRLNRHSVPYREEYGIALDDDEARLESYEPAEYAQPDTAGYVQQDGTTWREDARYLARVKLEAARCAQQRAKGRGALRGIEAGRTFTLTDHPHDEVNGEYLVLNCTLDIRGTPGTSTTLPEFSFEAEFGLHPTSEAWRMPQVTPRPRIDGYEHAVIVGYGDQPLTIDEYNRVRIQFAWDRQGKYNGKSSIWVRVAQPWQGNQMGTVLHGRHGQPVLVAYVNGDPDRPIVTAFAPDALNMPPWKLPDNRALTGIVSRTLGQGDASNHLALDDTENQQQAQLASDHAKSSLSLGYITRIEGNAGRQDARGEGFELRTDKHGVLRAALGLLITTVARPGAQGKVKDMGETVARLTGSRDIHDDLARQARRHDTQDPIGDQVDVTEAIRRATAELRGKTDAGHDAFPEFEAPHLTLSSAAGIQSTAAGSTHIASEQHTALTAGGHVSIAAGKSFFASVREKIAIYVQRAGFRLVAVAGRIDLDAKSDGMRLLARQLVEIISTGDCIDIASARRVRIKGGSSVLEISDEGIVGYTGGRFVVHAADHATDNPVSSPVDSPVTPENPGKFAAHHVLVEDGGGFAIPNQPYRLTLDDGRVIQGVTNELGELQMVTSHAVSFGTIELMSQSAPEDAIALTNISIHRDIDSSSLPSMPATAKRTTQVGGKPISTPDDGPTTQSKPAEYFSCDPLNFGLRAYRLIDGAKQEDTSPAFRSRHNIEYPVAKSYTAAMKKRLVAIDWSGLVDKTPAEITDVVAPAVQQPLWDALQNGSFGLLPGSVVDGAGTMPDVLVVGPNKLDEFGMKPNYAGGFVSRQWVIAINKSRIDDIINYFTPCQDKSLTAKQREDAQISLSEVLRKFANTLYHEARHAQQKYWMISLKKSYPDDYSRFTSLDKYYYETTRDSILSAISRINFPNDDRIKIGVHRLLLFDYYWIIKNTQSVPYYAFMRPDLEAVESEICKLLNISPETARLMVTTDDGYRSHLHEEDAWSCGDLVDSYWRRPDDNFLRNPGSCTREYGDAVRAIGGARNGQATS